MIKIVKTFQKPIFDTNMKNIYTMQSRKFLSRRLLKTNTIKNQINLKRIQIRQFSLVKDTITIKEKYNSMKNKNYYVYGIIGCLIFGTIVFSDTIKKIYIYKKHQTPEGGQQWSEAKWCQLLDQILIAGYLQMSGILKQMFGTGYTINYPRQNTLYEDIFQPTWITRKNKIDFNTEIDEKDFDFITICEVFGTNGRQGAIYLYRKINKSIIKKDNIEDIIYALENHMNRQIPELRELNTNINGKPIYEYLNIHKNIEDSIVGELLKLQFASLYIYDETSNQNIKIILCDNRNLPLDISRPLGFKNLGITYQTLMNDMHQDYKKVTSSSKKLQSEPSSNKSWFSWLW